jgi:Domain of unknown function (DUF4157)
MHSISEKARKNSNETNSVSEMNVFSKTENAYSQGNLFIQPKLTIGNPNDHYEQQADAVANHVMRMPENSFSAQRKCASCEHDEEKAPQPPIGEFVQRKPFDISPIIQKSGESSGDIASENISNQIESSRGNGQKMNTGTKSFMENRFGNNFSNVKIHTDSSAVQLSQNLNAQAFTVGDDVFFNEGKYNPNSSSGKHLLAHELTHTVQQTGTLQRYPNKRRPDYWSIPIDFEMIEDPVERMELMRREYNYYLWKNALKRLELGELDDKDLQFERLRNRLTGLKTVEMTDLITKIKAFQIQRDKDVADPKVTNPDKKIPVTTAKIIEWLEVRKQISTPMPDNAKVNYAILDVIDSYSISVGDILIKVLPDTHGANGNSTGPTTNLQGNFTWLKVGGKITALKKDGIDFNPTQLEVTILTKYKDSPDVTSGYGKGTTSTDLAEQTTTLRAHEGQHGIDFITYLSNTKLPASLSGGVNGKLTEAQFSAIIDYVKLITKATCEETDQSGFSQDEYLQTPIGISSGIRSCRTP